MLLTTLFLFLGNPRTIIFIIFILVLFFGAKRIPELFKGVGQGVREFKDASNPEQPANPNYNQQPGYNPNGYPQQTNGYAQQQPPYNNQGSYPQQPQQYGPPAQGQMPQAPYNPNQPYNPNNTPAS
ncbi:hypothetical protein A0257_18310 [Hymenobacter psoromatis]|nr:hypothetical protein A0257_18310 [Hymenobacter psoromatis]